MRVETIGAATLYLGDMLDVLPTLDGIDHVISDPPYEQVMHAAMGAIRRNDGQEMVQDLGFEGIDARRPEVARICVEKSNGWVLLFTLAEGVRAWRDDIQAAGAKYDTCLAWVKPDSSPRFNGQGAARGFECAVTAWCASGYRSWNGGGKRGVFVYNCNGDRPGGHPTEKPLRLMRELVSLYSNPGQCVADPFMGSGTTGCAAVIEGRRFIGIERDPKWFEVACRRIEQAQLQADLFIGSAA